VPDPDRVISTDGRSAFQGIDNAVLAVFWLLAVSVNLLAATLIEAVPDPDAGGVQVAVYVVPDPANALSVPVDTVTSPPTKSDDVSDNVKVIVMS